MLLTDYLVKKMEENKIIDDDIELYIYGLNNGFTIILNIVTAIVLSYIVQKENLVLFLLASFIPLRSYCGGIHSNSRLLCYIYSNIIITFLLLAQDYFVINIVVYIIITLISLLYLLFQKTAGNSVRVLDVSEVIQYTRIKRIILFVLAFVSSIFLATEKFSFATAIMTSINLSAILVILENIKNGHSLFCKIINLIKSSVAKE